LGATGDAGAQRRLPLEFQGRSSVQSSAALRLIRLSRRLRSALLRGVELAAASESMSGTAQVFPESA
jgi:hypothetical protein